MADSIYKFYYARPTEAWYQLSEQEQEALATKLEEALEEVGGKGIVACDSSWSSEEWPWCGVEEFPSIEAVERHIKLLRDLQWFRYVQSRTLLGKAWEA